MLNGTDDLQTISRRSTRPSDALYKRCSTVQTISRPSPDDQHDLQMPCTNDAQRYRRSPDHLQTINTTFRCPVQLIKALRHSPRGSAKEYTTNSGWFKTSSKLRSRATAAYKSQVIICARRSL